MSFCVCLKKRRENRIAVTALRVLCILAVAALVWFLNWDFMKEAFRQEGAYIYVIFWLFIGIFLLFIIASFQMEKRPRIEVNGQSVTFYPLWRASRTVTLGEITSRQARGDVSSERIDAAVGGALVGGPLAQALTHRYEAALQTPQAMAYTYYSGKIKLITISTKRMENVERFDRMVTERLEGRLPEAEVTAPKAETFEKPEAAAEKSGPAGKPKRPLVFAGVIGAVCICICILAAVILLRDPPGQSPDLLAGTSWRSGNDASQWVFDEDGTFHWYQTKGETDDNYFAGTYEFHIGQDAIHYLTNELSGYGVTEQEIQMVIRRRAEYTQDNFVCFSTTNRSFMLNGREQLSGEVVSSYFGFLLSDGTYLDIANMTTGTYYGFTKEQAS